MTYSRLNIVKTGLLIFFGTTLIRGQQTPALHRSIVDSALALNGVRAYFIEDNFQRTRENLKNSDVYFSNWRVRRILTELPTLHLPPADVVAPWRSAISGCVVDNFHFGNLALTNISNLGDSLFLMIAEPQNSWVMASYLQDEKSDTTTLKKIYNSLAYTDRSRLIDALNCYKIYDRFHIVLLYDSTRGIKFISEIYSPGGVKFLRRETSDHAVLNFLDYGYADFGGDRVDRTLVCYGVKKGSLDELLKFDYEKISGFDETRRKLSYSFEGDTLRMVGVEWPPGDGQGSRRVGYPDSATSQHVSFKFVWKSGQFIWPSDREE